MGAAHVVLIINVAVAALFAAAYLAVALTLPTQRKALWFALAYCVGIAKPLADALLPFVAFPEAMEWLGYVGFLAALLLMSPALRLFHEQAAHWRMPVIILVGGVALRWLIFAWDRTSFAHGVAYQAPFVAAAALGCWTVLRLPESGRVNMVLSALFGLLAVQFMAKPWIAVTFGAGQTLADYVASRYALISQALTGISLIAVGLTLLLLVVQRAISASNAMAEIDPLSGLLNRRGFDRRGEHLLARSNVVAMLADLDHFKQINDRYGHAVGDQVIVQFARLMRDAAPSDALLARLGGEEFALLFPASLDEGLYFAEVLREMVGATSSSLPIVTASIGVAEMRVGGGGLDSLMRLADAAAYAAKRAGRDRIAVAPLMQLAA
jgi:diguanylate cyclase (GGDEF)-like protein